MRKNTNTIKNSFYNKLKVTKEIREIIKSYRQWKQNILNEPTLRG